MINAYPDKYTNIGILLHNYQNSTSSAKNKLIMGISRFYFAHTVWSIHNLFLFLSLRRSFENVAWTGFAHNVYASRLEWTNGYSKGFCNFYILAISLYKILNYFLLHVEDKYSWHMLCRVNTFDACIPFEGFHITFLRWVAWSRLVSVYWHFFNQHRIFTNHASFYKSVYGRVQAYVHRRGKSLNCAPNLQMILFL